MCDCVFKREVEKEKKKDTGGERKFSVNVEREWSERERERDVLTYRRKVFCACKIAIIFQDLFTR